MKSLNLNKLKNRALLLITLLFMVFVTSCDKEVTELEPFDRITEATAFATPARVELCSG